MYSLLWRINDNLSQWELSRLSSKDRTLNLIRKEPNSLFDESKRDMRWPSSRTSLWLALDMVRNHGERIIGCYSCMYCRIVVVGGEPEQMATDTLNTISNGKAFAI